MLQNTKTGHKVNVALNRDFYAKTAQNMSHSSSILNSSHSISSN